VVVLLLVAFAGVVGVKYYTSMGMRALERRLHSVQADLYSVKKQRTNKDDEQKGAAKDEEAFEERIRSMKEIISDLEYRLTTAKEVEPATF